VPQAPTASRAKQTNDYPTLFLASRFGIGRWHLGKADMAFDPNTGIEQFKTTIFILLLWFPLIPTGSYLIRKRRGFFSRRITVLQRLPLDWAQVLRVWATSVCALWILIWVLKRI
jgi:hypothetical protein